MSYTYDWQDPNISLPENNKYVLIHLPDKPWSDDDDPRHVFVRVAKFKRGITLEERLNLPDSDPRKHSIKREDEFGNNKRAYYWQEFGPEYHFGQEVVEWAYFEV